ncbi:BON domain-containing protein [Lysobacteraceae bacterium NML91-0213]|nr:BON domain-containing protein [Xanthomonadaceae bacterium NML91-0213]
MTNNITRIPLAIALSSVLAFAVGCTADRNDDGVANDPAMQTPAGTVAADMDRNDAATDANPGAIGDGRDSDQPVDDTWITTKVKSSLLADSDVSGLDINVDTLNGVVTLQGQVESQAQIDTATRIARGIEGVTDVQTTNLTVGNAQ